MLIFFLNGYSDFLTKKENEDNLWSEVLKERTRANKVYEFNMSLPYNEDYRGEFEMVMDDEMFEPICGRRRIETSNKGYIKIGKKIKNGQIIDLVCIFVLFLIDFMCIR